MFITKFNGDVSMPLTNSYRPIPAQIRRNLDQLDGDEDFAYLMYYVPDDAGWPDAPNYDATKYVDTFMQSAGSSDAMTIEIKRKETDGEYHQYAVGRLGDASARTVEISFAGNTLTVPSSEVFDASQAADVYYTYFQTRGIPQGLTLRELDLA